MKKKWLTGFELLLIIVSVYIATFAWFSHNKEIQTNDLSFRTNSVTELLLSLDQGKTWSSSLTLNLPTDFTFGNEITGNGISFYSAASKKDDGTPITFQKATANRDYLEFEIQFKTSNKVGIFLEKNSFVFPLAGTSADRLLGKNVERISSSGDFSRDLIAGAVRIAFIENQLVDGKYVPKNTTSMVWAPNKNYKVDCSTGYCLASIEATEEQKYFYVDASESSYYFEKRVASLKEEITASYDDMNGYGDPMLLYIPAEEGIASMTVRIWIEGNDRDAVTALTGGMFYMNLSFLGIDKQTNQRVPAVTADSVNQTITGYEEGMEYSLDYGNTWKQSLGTIEAGKTVYVRYSETKDTFASKIKILTFS